MLVGIGVQNCGMAADTHTVTRIPLFVDVEMERGGDKLYMVFRIGLTGG